MKTKTQITQETQTLKKGTELTFGEYQVVIGDVMYNNYQVIDNELNSHPVENMAAPFQTFSKYPSTKKEFVKAVFDVVSYFERVLKKEQF